MMLLKKNKLISVLLFLIFVVSLFSSLGLKVTATNEIIAKDENSDQTNDANTNVCGEKVENIFKNKSVEKCDFLYNLDDSADYIYVEFKNGGYAIFSSLSMEMMEYSLQGELPYSSNNRGYYAGPSSYLEKIDSHFVDILTNTKVHIQSSEAEEYAVKSREVIVGKKMDELLLDCYEPNNETIGSFKESLNIGDVNPSNSRSGTPEIDESDLIVPSELTGKLIPNYRYFLSSPIHGDNINGQTYANGNYGTCTAVASQLLLGYHNYYSDRRIIEDKYLLGYDPVTNTVVIPDDNPNHCSDPMSMTTHTLGTSSGRTGEFSYYVKVIESMMDPGEGGISIIEAVPGIRSLLNERISSSGYEINYNGIWEISSIPIKSEIDEGRPVIIGLHQLIGGIMHAVVGYGYQNYTYPDSNETYEGYIVHFGWQGDTCVWINSSWCNNYLALKINHTHNYSTVGTIPGTTRTEYRCSTCGHRTDAAITMSSSERYVERVATIPQNGYRYKDYYVKFSRAGYKLFQTFGQSNTEMYLFDDEYNQLAYDDNDGSSVNALFSYNVEANKPYILRVKFLSNTLDGDIKIGITPADDTSISAYENIWSYSGTGASYAFVSIQYMTKVMTFVPSQSGVYTFDLKYVGDTRVDTYMYFIDPYSTSPCMYNDDGGGDLQARITANLVAGRRYFIVTSPYLISTSQAYLLLKVTKA